MGSCKRFEDLEIWQKSHRLCVRVYQLMSPIKDYGFKDQIQRAAVSIMNNIAEGFERETDDDFARFLSYSKGSCGEVRSLLRLAESLGYAEDSSVAVLLQDSVELSRQIKALMNYLKQSRGRK